MPAQWLTCPHCQVFYLQPDNEPALAKCPSCKKSLAVQRATTAPPRWFYIRDKHKVGPVAFSLLREVVSAGGLKPDDMLLQEGTTRWAPASSLDGLFPTAPSPVTPPPVPLEAPPVENAFPSIPS